METKERYEENDSITIDINVLIKDIFRGIRKFWLMGLGLIIVGAVLVSVVSVVLYKPMYKVKVSFSIATTLNVSDTTENDEYGFYYNQSTASLMADSLPYVLSSSVMQDILKEDLGTEEINGEISAKAISDSNIFSVTVVSDSAQDAYDIVNAIVKDYPEIAKYVIGDSQTNIIQNPSMPKEPYNQVSLIMTSVLGAFAGFMIWCIILLIYAITRNTIRKEENIRDRLNQHCYGSLPVIRRYGKKSDEDAFFEVLNHRDGFREDMNRVATRIANDLKKEEDKIVIITSALPGEGKSTFSVNLAAALGQRGSSVLLIDADLYKQNMSAYIKEKEHSFLGLIEYYKGEASIDDIIYKAKELSCDVITGTVDLQESGISTAEILSSRKIGSLLKILREHYEYILIDTPPCEVMSDATEISRYADKAIFVIRHDYAKVKHIMDSMQNLHDSRIAISGCVLNGVSDDSIGYGKYGYGKYGYGRYGYGKYGYGSDKK